MSKRRAAKIRNIPITKLRNLLKNERMRSSRLGRKPIFSDEQEHEIAK